MSEKRKIIRVYDKTNSDLDSFNDKIKKAEDDGWIVTGIEYNNSNTENKSDSFVAYLMKPVAEKTVVPPPEPPIEDLPFRAATFLDSFTKCWCIDDNAAKEGDLKFKCNICPFDDINDCRIKRFANDYAPWYKNFGAMSR